MKNYIVRTFDGEYSYVGKVFSTKEKAEQYRQESIEYEIKHYGFQMESYFIDEYEVL